MIGRHFYPQERKSQSSLFWFGLGMNIFVGNVIAINLQERDHCEGRQIRQ